MFFANCIRWFFSNTICRLKFSETLGPKISSSCGVETREDDLGPLLFDNIISNLIREVQLENLFTVKVGNVKDNILMYADDIIILSENSKGFRNAWINCTMFALPVICK